MMKTNKRVPARGYRQELAEPARFEPLFPKLKRGLVGYVASKVSRGLGQFGPGIVTGAADDDPSGIATYSQVGAQFGFAMLWTMLFSYPLMAGIQEISAWIGRVTGIGLAGNIRRHYSVWVLYPVVALLLLANVINLGADISAMGSALRLLVGGPALFYSIVFGILSVIAAVFVPYRRYAQLLKWAALVLLVYVATAFVVHVHWQSALAGAFVPTIFTFKGLYDLADCGVWNDD
jgi:NRAMP (natural resistance-associated macrophage protein)-like metal ion transporter